MLRKNIRMRREYLFNKEQEKTNTDKFDKKLKLKNALLGNIHFSPLFIPKKPSMHYEKFIFSTKFIQHSLF